MSEKTHGSAGFISERCQEGAGRSQVGRLEALGERRVERGEEGAGLVAPTPRVPQLGQLDPHLERGAGGAEAAGRGERAHEAGFGLARVGGVAAEEQDLAAETMEVHEVETLLRAFGFGEAIREMQPRLDPAREGGREPEHGEKSRRDKVAAVVS